MPWNNAANAFVSLHRYAEAEQAIRRSIAIERNGMNLVTLGNILVKLKKCVLKDTCNTSRVTHRTPHLTCFFRIAGTEKPCKHSSSR